VGGVDPGVARSSTLLGADGRPLGVHYARVSKPGSGAYALLWGLTFLTGEPRGIAEIELLTLIVGPSVLLIRSSYWIQTWRGAHRLRRGDRAGLAWGCAIGLVQLLPGWSFIGISQRSSISYGYFGAGSLVVRWTSLLFMPDIFGGNGSGGQPNILRPLQTCPR